VGLGEAFSEQAFDLIQKIAKSPHQFPSVAPPVRRALAAAGAIGSLRWQLGVRQH